MEKDGGIWVFKGATLDPDMTVQDHGESVEYGYIKGQRNQMKKAGVLSAQPDGSYRLAQDWRFESSSTAGAVLAWQQCNGCLKWKVFDDGPHKRKILDELLRP